MSARTPEVVTGARGPSSERQAEAKKRAAGRSTAALDVPVGKVIFQANAARYRLQLPALEMQKGKKWVEIPRVVQFDNFTSKPYDETKDKEIIELVRESLAYGTSIFEVTQLQEQARRAKVQAVKSQLETDPAFRAEVLEALKLSGEDDFSLPQEKGQKKKDKSADASASAGVTA